MASVKMMCQKCGRWPTRRGYRMCRRCEAGVSPFRGAPETKPRPTGVVGMMTSAVSTMWQMTA